MIPYCSHTSGSQSPQPQIAPVVEGVVVVGGVFVPTEFLYQEWFQKCNNSRPDWNARGDV